MTSRSKYTSAVVDDVLCVVDLDQPGSRSVTNDVEQVVAELRANDLLPPGRRLIYRDSDGRWDEIVVSADGRFAGFLPLRSLTLDEALAKLKAQT